MREIWLERYTVLQGSQTAHVIEGVSIGLRDIRFYKALKHGFTRLSNQLALTQQILIA